MGNEEDIVTELFAQGAEQARVVVGIASDDRRFYAGLANGPNDGAEVGHVGRDEQHVRLLLRALEAR